MLQYTYKVEYNRYGGIKPGLLPAPVANIMAFSVGVTKWDIRNWQSKAHLHLNRNRIDLAFV